MMGLRLQADSPQVVDGTIKLVQYLKELVRSGPRPQTDLKYYPEVLWLGDLPAGISVRSSGEASGSLSVLSMEFQAETLAPEPPRSIARFLDVRQLQEPNGQIPELELPEPEMLPAVTSPDDSEPDLDRADLLAQYRDWAEEWRRWAATEKSVRSRKKIYSRLAAMHRTLSQQDDVLEAVLAVGVVNWKPQAGPRVVRHLVTRRVRINVHRETQRLEVMLDAEAVLRLEDRDFLDGFEGYSRERAAALREAFSVGDQHPLSDETRENLDEWRRRAFDRASDLVQAWDPPEAHAADVTALITWSPAIILRKRDHNALVDYYEKIEGSLSMPEALMPLGLAQLVLPIDAEDRAVWGSRSGVPSASVSKILGDDPLFPRPTNGAQRDILKRLEHEECVVVQGPPGTGKTHTIANLVSALLAQGQRVLVTSQKDQALRVLRQQLPEPIQSLCVLMTGQRSDRGAVPEQERTLSAFADRLTTSQSDDVMRRITSLEEQRHALRSRIAETEERIWRLRLAETERHPEVAPGYSGTRAEIADALRRSGADLNWAPRPVPTNVAEILSQLERFRDLLRSASPDRAASMSAWVPENLPDAETFATFAARLRALRSDAAQIEHDEWVRDLTTLDEEQRKLLEQACRQASEAVHRLWLEPDPRKWPDGAWQTRFLSDGAAKVNGRLWERVLKLSKQIDDDRRAIERFDSTVRLPMMPLAVLESFRRDAQEWHDHIAAGGRPGRRAVRGLRERIVPQLEACLVGGAVPSGPESIAAVVAWANASITLERIAEAYRNVGVEPVDGVFEVVQEEYSRRAELMKAAHGYRYAVEGVKQNLEAAGVRILIRSPDDLHRLERSLEKCRSASELRRREDGITRLVREFRTSPGALDSPILPRLVAAITDADEGGYREVLRDIEQLGFAKFEETEYRELLEELGRTYPAFIRLMIEKPADPRWDRMEEVRAAIAWAQAADFIDSGATGETDQRLAADLRADELKLMQVTGDLAALKAWRHVVGRMTQEQQSALQSFKQALGRLGKGTGTHASRHRAAVRSAMARAQNAVPAWVMPINQVVETIPARADRFDVVVVDEASQVGVEALFLRWLAPRMVVVGDEKQCTPLSISHGKHDVHFQNIDELLPDMPSDMRGSLAPASNLYEAMTARSPRLVRLLEHFRCMPEIIGWSSDEFYNRELEPVRQFGADRLPPLKVVHIEGAYTDGSQSEIRNPVEAKQIIETLRALFDAAAYRNRTFGVIVLQGYGQIRLLENMIAEAFDEREIEAHSLRVGGPAEFQGDERDVVLLSMVVVTALKARTSREDQQRFNVAASRARDQMWLFTSVEPTRLNETDLRFKLLRYMQDPPPALLASPVKPAEVSADEPCAPFDSLFEQRVYLRIIERGFTVVPQVRVGERRIDLVVVGAKGRLAVECDGDRWHSTVEQRKADLRRERELVRVGWRFWRVRESVFNLDPEAALQPLWERLKAFEIEPDRLAPAMTAVGEGK